MSEAAPEWIELANDIRAIDGNHDMGAATLAAALTARGWTRRLVETMDGSLSLGAMFPDVQLELGDSIEVRIIRSETPKEPSYPDYRAPMRELTDSESAAEDMTWD